MTEPTNVRTLPLRSHAIPARDDRYWITSHELITDAGITYRQLDYWTRTGLFTPLDGPQPGSGAVHRFTDAQVTRARAIRQVLDAGVSLQTIREVIDELAEHGQVDLGHVTLTLHRTGGDAA